MTRDDTLRDAERYWNDVWRAEEHDATEAALREEGPPYPATRREFSAQEGVALPPRRQSPKFPRSFA